MVQFYDHTDFANANLVAVTAPNTATDINAVLVHRDRPADRRGSDHVPALLPEDADGAGRDRGPASQCPVAAGRHSEGGPDPGRCDCAQ